MLRKITELAKVVRSKNCSPFELTLDIIFRSRRIYDTVKRHDLINPKMIAQAYGIPETKISNMIYFDL